MDQCHASGRSVRWSAEPGAHALSQAQLAKRIGKPASFVGKYEVGERRLDVVELLVVLNALEENASGLMLDLCKQVPERL